MKVGLIAPMPSELKPLVRALSMQRVMPDDARNYVGVIGDTELVATTSGMGTQLATQAAERLLELGPFDHVMVVGIAGGLGATKVGDVILPESVVDKRTRTEYTPFPLVSDVKSKGRLVTHDEFDMQPDEHEQLVAEGFIAVDMETAAVAAVCEQRETRWSVVRVVSDIVGVTPGDVIGLAHPDGSPNVAAGLKYMLRHPGRIPGLVRLGRDGVRAANTAATTAARTLRSAQ
jgi:adenosylhomocysteine nucleosidase